MTRQSDTFAANKECRINRRSKIILKNSKYQPNAYEEGFY